MGKDRTNSKSYRRVVGHLEVEGVTATLVCCPSLGLDSEFRWDTALLEQLCCRELEQVGKKGEKVM